MIMVLMIEPVLVSLERRKFHIFQSLSVPSLNEKNWIETCNMGQREQGTGCSSPRNGKASDFIDRDDNETLSFLIRMALRLMILAAVCGWAVAALDFNYHSRDQLEAYLVQVNRDYPQLTSLYSIGKSVQGLFSINAYKFLAWELRANTTKWSLGNLSQKTLKKLKKGAKLSKIGQYDHV